ncbi:MAG: ABC transporter ATP-binding protein [Gammaproteobacteria bacterium]|nr:ABC transporter ATP-binding protein [Gammaproteobacteria bacterium]
MSRLSLQQLDVSIAGKSICRQLDLCIEPGQVWGILGRNGTGKTTLIHTLAGLREADAGAISLDQQDIAQLTRKQVAQKIGVLLQHTEDPFPSTVLETVVTGRHPHINHWQWESREDYQLAQQALEQVEMLGLQQRQVNQLSGGERQRVSIATLLTQDPAIFLLDEPNTHLDLNYQISLLSYLSDYVRQNQRSIVMSLHDINLAARFCDHLLFLLDDGKTLAGPTAKLLNSHDLEALFQHPIDVIEGPRGNLYIPR